MTEYNFAGFNLARDIVHATAVEKGWWEPQEQIVALPLEGGPVTAMVQRSFGDLIALVHGEASEALEEHRAGRHPDEMYYRYNDAKPEGIPAELADVIIQVLNMCGYYGIDIEHAMLVKTKYNESRAHRHGGKP